MTYETGTATSPDDLLSKFRTFVLANGYTENSLAVQGSGRRFHFHKGSNYVNMRSYMGETLSNANGDLNNLSTAGVYGIGINCSDSYNGANVWGRQPGAPINGSIGYGGYCPMLSSTIPAYHFFSYADSDDIIAVIEYSSTLYQYFAFGAMVTYTAGIAGDGRWFSASSDNATPEGGAPFYTSHSAASAVRLNFLSVDAWFGIAGSTSTYPSRGQQFFDANAEAATANPYSFKTKLLPFTVYVAASSVYYPVGELKHMRRLSIANYAAAEEFSLGGDTWKVFPTLQKGGSSGQSGFAIRKVA